MKRTDLLSELDRRARTAGVQFSFVRHGAKHDIYRFGGHNVPIPRHREIKEGTVRNILGQTEG